MSDKGQPPIRGLKLLRNNTHDRSPRYHCDNCKCKRYSPCTCMRPGFKAHAGKE